MKVSIITTCYNREKTIRNAIESVLFQNYPDIEYIVIDGASQDNSLSVIREYSNKINTIISEPDRNMYEAINKGIHIASGDIIGLLHSDDSLFANNTISNIVQKIQQEDCDLIYGNGLYVDFNNTNKIIRNWISGPYSKKNICNGWLPLHPTVYTRRKCIQRLGLYDESFKISSDTDFLIRYLYTGNLKVSYINDYIVRMRMGGVSTNLKTQMQKWIEDIKIYQDNQFNPYWALTGKTFSKIPQFITAKFIHII
ncbi:PGL/p-HBAD biosynthesis glycosyltransferase [termite gut metagenome]|uniref:PGL/p-HBAD biosynthesis glycosyltransferase n=1 Tax=termite gut metagenome TaxID=433724 RepID=A0A5J4S369_9ZZZZ